MIAPFGRILLEDEEDSPKQDIPQAVTDDTTTSSPFGSAIMDAHQDRIDDKAHEAANNDDLAGLANAVVQQSFLDRIQDSKAPQFVKGDASMEARPADQAPDTSVVAPFGSAIPKAVESPFGSAVAEPTYTGPGKPVAKGELIPIKQLPQDKYQYRNQQIDQAIDQAQSQNTPEGQEMADRLRALKMSEAKPWGSAENHPGVLGKIGHVLGRIGNIAGDIFAPATMVNIPGTDLNRRARAGGLQNAIHEDEAAVDRRDAADAKADKTKYTMKDVTDNRKTLPNGATNPNFGKTVVAGVNESDPTDVKYTGQLAAGAPSASTTPLGAPEIGNSNDGFTNRWQVLHPGQVLPKQYVLPAGATQKDFERVDKQLEQVEKAEGTKAQQDQTNQMRKDAAAAIQAQREIANREHDEVQGRKMVIGTDPSTNREVMVPVEQAKSMGLKDIYDAPADAVNKALSARHFIPLADNADPGDPGIIQMIDQMDKEGKLGVVANRWNDFLAGKVGAGDPEFERLRVAMGLATTLLMNAHVGSRGGAYMMEHFEDLANAKKMNAETLRAGVDQELKYIKSRAMTPSSSSEVAKPKSLSKTEQVQLDALKKKHGLQ